MSATAIWGAMLFWTVATVIVAAVARRGMGAGSTEFFIGGRRLSGFVSGMTYAATTYSAFMLVGLVGLTYRSGVGALGFEMTYLVFTVLFLIVFGPRFWLVGRRFDHVTPPELLAHRYNNKWIAVVAAIISFVMLIPYSAVQLMGAGFLVSGLTGGEVPYMLGVLVMALLSGFAAWWAGMRSVAWTDAIQGIVMLVTSITALAIVAYSFFGSPGGFFDTVTRESPELLRFNWDPNFFIGITLPWAFFALTNPQVSQRMYIPNTVASLRRMVLFFAIFGFLYTIISTFFGMQSASIVPGLENADNAMPSLMTKLPGAISLILFLGIFAAASSTLGSIILTLSSLFARDVIKHLRPDVSERVERGSGRVALIVLLLACIGFAWLRPGLITVLSSMASGGLLVMAPAIIGAFFWRRGTAPAALISMAVGGVLTAVLYISGWQPLGWWASVWGAIVTTLLFVAVSLVTTAPEGASKFIDDLEAELVENGFRKGSRRT